MDWLTTRPTGDEVLNPFAIISLAVFAIVVLASGFYSARPWSPPFGETQSRRFVQRAATLLAWPAGLGLFFLVVRLLQIDPATFGRPIWIVLSWIALIVTAGALAFLAPKDREAKRRRRAGHRPSQLSRRPVRRKGSI
jgi:hypothetical protein